MIAHCLFEQSGTFKKELKKLGIEAYDYDILNDFNETDYQIDLFKEIEFAYEGKESVFDKMTSDDIVFAFFPCVRFEDQIQLWYRGVAHQCKNWSDEKKIKYAMKLHSELEEMYQLFSKLCLIALDRGLKLIIENPYSPQHHLVNYFPIKAKYIDYNRRIKGDYYKKPTQFWFINCEPHCNLFFEPRDNHQVKKVSEECKVERSMISKEYARNFIREIIL